MLVLIFLELSVSSHRVVNASTQTTCKAWQLYSYSSLTQSAVKIMIYELLLKSGLLKEDVMCQVKLVNVSKHIMEIKRSTQAIISKDHDRDWGYEFDLNILATT